jgi:hypothetical protein
MQKSVNITLYKKAKIRISVSSLYSHHLNDALIKNLSAIMKKHLYTAAFLCLFASAATAQLTDVATGLNRPWALEIKGNDLYVALDNDKKVIKIDISQANPVPVLVAELTTIGDAGGLSFKDNDLYIGYYAANKIRKINVAQSGAAPVDVANVISPTGILVDGDYLYVAQWLNGIERIELANTNNRIKYPKPTGFNFFNGGIAVKGNTLYYTMAQAVTTDGPGGIYRQDLSQPNSPAVRIGPNLSLPSGLTLYNNYLYIAEYNKISRIDLSQANPAPETVATGLSGARLTAFNGVDLFIPHYDGNKASKLSIGQPTFPALPEVCVGAILNKLGGATPTGGVYSGQGVTDNGNGNNFTFNAAAGPGTYPVLYTSASGQTLNGSITVTNSNSVNAAASMGPIPGSATVVATGGSGTYTYAWNTTPPQTTATATGLGAGSYTVTVTDAGGCSAVASVDILSSAATDIGETNIRLAPNPTSGLVELSNIRAEAIQVFDYTGRMVQQSAQPGNSIDLSGQAPGLYFLQIREQGKLYSARVVKE